MRGHDDYNICSMKRDCEEVNKPISCCYDCAARDRAAWNVCLAGFVTRKVGRERQKNS